MNNQDPDEQPFILEINTLHSINMIISKVNLCVNKGIRFKKQYAVREHYVNNLLQRLKESAQYKMTIPRGVEVKDDIPMFTIADIVLYLAIALQNSMVNQPNGFLLGTEDEYYLVVSIFKALSTEKDPVIEGMYKAHGKTENTN
jgi:hypothetical protein